MLDSVQNCNATHGNSNLLLYTPGEAALTTLDVKMDFQLKFKISALLSGRLHLMWERLTQVTSLLDHGLDLQHL